MNVVHIRPNQYDKSTWKTVEVEDLTEFLATMYKALPPNTKIYHNGVDVSPVDDESVNHLMELSGEFYVIVNAGYGDIIAAVVAVISLLVSAYTILTMPKPPLVSAPQSANNDLANRSNKPRLGGRILEFFGYGLCYPDLIAEPFVYYNSGFIEIEETLMVATRGYVNIYSGREDNTDVRDISGYAVSAYDPHTSIIGNPIFQVGERFTEAPTYSMKSDSFNGQTTDVPNNQVSESSGFYFSYPNNIHSDGVLDFTTVFAAGDNIAVYGADYGVSDHQWSGRVILTASGSIVIESADDVASVNSYKGALLTGAQAEFITEIPPPGGVGDPTYVTTYRDLSGQYAVQGISKTTIPSGFQYVITLSNPSSVNPAWQYVTEDKDISCGVQLNRNENSLNLSGSYSIESVTPTLIKLKNPEQSNQDWLNLPTLPNGSTSGQPELVRLDKLDNKWIGWHNIVMSDCENLVINLFFTNGLFYQDSKGGVWNESMTVVVEYQKINELLQPVGDVFSIQRTVTRNSKSAFGMTINIPLDSFGPVRLRVARTTPTKNDKSQDLCKVKDVYGTAKSKVLNYGDVTVFRVKAIGTEGALSIKERKFNALLGRKLPLNGTGALTETRSAFQALIYLALDPENGRRKIGEVDVDQILSVERDAVDYFGDPRMVEFNGTIDDSGLSFQDIAGMVMSAAFSEAYRFGSKLRVRFEKPQSTAALLFGAHNKLLGSSKQTKSFGIKNNYDGVELEYTSPDDDTRITYVASDSQAPQNTRKIKSQGIRGHKQAKARAWREWNKMKYQQFTAEFTATEESNLVARNDKILNADMTKKDAQSGFIENISGLVAELSAKVRISDTVASYIQIQLRDGSIDIIECLGRNDYSVNLFRPPRSEIARLASYNIVPYLDSNINAFLVTDIRPQGTMNNILTCVNYDSRYYEKDLEQ